MTSPGGSQCDERRHLQFRSTIFALYPQGQTSGGPAKAVAQRAYRSLPPYRVWQKFGAFNVADPVQFGKFSFVFTNMCFVLVLELERSAAIAAIAVDLHGQHMANNFFVQMIVYTFVTNVPYYVYRPTVHV